ncbi:MAG: hypothetical protein CVU03_13960 [Bacteroidetes bacterium HGW-Bacteroidetes-2]|nr:MAG: hypothetical protein CVU08_15910 [Bacteroidetes bacterium HGW-Bacteroidetes-3]PKP24024.1 MAG: hypothetical protein CVU03_13960 [Bacteroidetes bacterium HGW-Bacteroidetes-2]
MNRATAGFIYFFFKSFPRKCGIFPPEIFKGYNQNPNEKRKLVRTQFLIIFLLKIVAGWNELG